MDTQTQTQKKTLAFLKLLIQNGLVKPEKLKEIGDIRDREFTQILEDLIDNGIVGEEKIKDFFIKFFHLKPYNPAEHQLNKENEVLKKISYSYMMKKKFVPFDYKDGKALIASFNPADKDVNQYLKFIGIDSIDIYVATLSEVMNLLNELATQTSASEIMEGIDLGVEIEEEVIKEDEELPGTRS